LTITQKAGRIILREILAQKTIESSNSHVGLWVHSRLRHWPMCWCYCRHKASPSSIVRSRTSIHSLHFQHRTSVPGGAKPRSMPHGTQDTGEISSAIFE